MLRSTETKWRSKTGWGFAIIYAVAAAVLFTKAFTCQFTFCAFIDLPVFAPAGALYYWVYDLLVENRIVPGYIPNPEVTWGFVIPAVVANVLLYYYVGRCVGRYLGRHSKESHENG